MNTNTSHIPASGFKKVRLNKIRGPVLVTGAAGFIGRRLVNRLLSEGCSVVAMDIVACPESLAEVEALKWLKGSVVDYSSVQNALKKVKTVFHLAAMVGDWGAADQHRQVTVEGTENLFKAIHRLGNHPTVVLASSIVVYGEQIGTGICHEALPLGKTFGPYSESKQAQERLVSSYLQQGQDIRIVRPANVYGAGSKPWVEELCKELKRGIPTLISGGDFDAGLVHVDNVVDILVRVARGSRLSGQVFNAADEEGITWKCYMTDLAKLCGAPAPGSLPRMLAGSMALVLEKTFRLTGAERRPPLTREALNLVGSPHHIDMTKTRTILSYQPLVSYSQGMAEVERYIRA